MPCSCHRSWPGVARPSTRSQELLVQIVPFRVIQQDEADLPGARVVLQVLLALPCVADILVLLKIHEALQAVTLGETLDKALAMLPGATRQIVGHADVQDAIRPVRHEVNPSGGHLQQAPRGSRPSPSRGWPGQARP